LMRFPFQRSAPMRFFDQGRRWLACHLHRLRRTLEALCQRLREGVAIAAGRAAEDAVREAVHHLLGDTPALGPPEYPRSNFPAPAGWRDTDDVDEELRRWEENLDNEHDDRRSANPDPQPESARFRRALAEGLQAASWWLRRGGNFPLLKAVAMG